MSFYFKRLFCLVKITMAKGGQTGCLETTPCLFGDYALPAWRLRLAYM